MLMLDSNPDSSSPDTRPARPSRLNPLTSRPDLIGEADQNDNNLSANSNPRRLQNGLKRSSKDENLHLLNGISNSIKDNPNVSNSVMDITKGMTPGALDIAKSLTQGAIDIEKVMASVTAGASVMGETSEDNEEDDGASTAIDITEAATIRRQLDGLENMYGEVLKLLGLRKFGRPAHQPSYDPSNGPSSKSNGQLRRHKMYGSMSSLPSVSSIGSRPLYSKSHQKGLGGKSEGQKRSSSSGTRGERSQNKRFQRLESHVVTLARSVAHLSSEVRNQQLILQEVEALRQEVHQLRQTPMVPAHQTQPQSFQNRSSFFHNPVSPAHANRVKKLTKFFGDEPPLLRLFLKNLGYEKYASVFEDAKIGMLELPYLSEDRLEKLGIPMGPRMRILQESRASLQQSHIPMTQPMYQPMTQPMTPNLPTMSMANTTSATATGGADPPNNYNVYIL